MMFEMKMVECCKMRVEKVEVVVVVVDDGEMQGWTERRRRRIK